MAGVNYIFTQSSIQPIDGVISFSESTLRDLSISHHEALVLTLEVRRHLMKWILVDHGSAVDLLYLPFLLHLGYKLNNLRNPGRVLARFKGSQTNALGEIVQSILVGPITSLVSLTVIDELSSFNSILGSTWIHAMKALSSSYHQMLSLLIPQGQIDIRGD